VSHPPSAALIVVLLFPHLPVSVGQNQADLPKRPEPIQVQPAASAPAAQALKPAPASDVPQPTVVLKPGETPGITFKEPVYNFGRVRAGADVAHEFVFTNTGNGPLEILQVKPACGCTTSGEYERIIQPGQSGKLPFKLSTKGMGGHTSKTIAVHTNAPALESRITLTIEGEVWEPVGFEPKAVTWGRLTAEAARAPGLIKKVTVFNNTEQPADLTNVRSNSPLFAVEPPTIVEPGKKFELIVRIASGLKPGNNNGTIDLSTGVADAPTLSIPLSAYILADVEATPNGIVLTPDNRQTTQQRLVTVQNNTQKPLKLAEPKLTNPALKVTTAENKPGLTYTLTVEIPPDCVLAPDGEKLTVKTDCATVPEIVIPIREIRVPLAAAGSATQVASAAPAPTPAAGAAPTSAPAANPVPAPTASSAPAIASATTGLPPPAPGTKVPVNDVDPVTGKPLTPSSPTLAYKGYAIGFCCAQSAGYTGAWERMSEKDKDAFVRKYLK
jgi:hypothetical protein